MLQKFVVIVSLCCLYHVVDCQSVLLKVLKPCAVTDGECLKVQWHDAVQVLADEGDKELDISPIDPLVLQNVTINIPGLVELTLIDGTAQGLKSCKFNDVKIDLNKGTMNATVGLQCTLSIGGHYKVSAQSSIIPGLVSDELLKADGQGKVKLTKLKIKLFLEFNPSKNKGGDYVLRLKKGPIRYEKNFGGKVSFEADNIYLAGQDISNVVLTFMNGNWKLIMDTFGGAFFDRGMIIFADLMKKVFKNIPAKVFISDSLDEYFV